MRGRGTGNGSSTYSRMWCENLRIRSLVMDRQQSSGSTTAILPGENGGPASAWVSSEAELDSTVIPIREEFRIRRLWFFYHDLRAFTTSWLPLPLFAVYRVLLFLYIFAWLIVSAALNTSGGKWLVFLTNLSYLVLVLGTGVIAILCVVYTVLYYVKRDSIQNLPKIETSIQLTYAQDNIAWYVKLVWFLYISGSTLAVLVTIGFWAVVYGCDSDRLNSSNTTNLTANCAPSALTVHVHGVNGLLAIIDIFISRVPFQFLHLFYPTILTALYALLNGVYFAASGDYVYSAINYRDSLGTAIGLVIVLALSATPIYIILFLLAWFRDVVYKRVACCFRDIRHVGDYNKPHTANGKPHTVNGTDEKNPDEMVEIAFEA